MYLISEHIFPLYIITDQEQAGVDNYFYEHFRQGRQEQDSSCHEEGAAAHLDSSQREVSCGAAADMLTALKNDLGRVNKPNKKLPVFEVSGAKLRIKSEVRKCVYIFFDTAKLNILRVATFAYLLNHKQLAKTDTRKPLNNLFLFFKIFHSPFVKRRGHSLCLRFVLSRCKYTQFQHTTNHSDE